MNRTDPNTCLNNQAKLSSYVSEPHTVLCFVVFSLCFVLCSLCLDFILCFGPFFFHKINLLCLLFWCLICVVCTFLFFKGYDLVWFFCCCFCFASFVFDVPFLVLLFLSTFIIVIMLVILIWFASYFFEIFYLFCFSSVFALLRFCFVFLVFLFPLQPPPSVKTPPQ